MPEHFGSIKKLQEKGSGFKLSIVLYDQVIDFVPSKPGPSELGLPLGIKSSSIFNPKQLFIRYSLLFIFFLRY